MIDKTYLQQVIALAEASTEPIKCACIIVKDGTVVASAYNSQRADNVAIHHAEVKAVKVANEKLGNRKLTGAAAYCSCEPCVMCLTALSLAQVERIVFAQTMKDVAPNDPMAQLDATEFASKYLNFVPKLERLVV